MLCPSALFAPLRAVFATSPLRYIGRISYGIYLYHLIVLFALDINPAKVDQSGTSMSRLLLAVALTFGIAALSYQFVEAPLLRLKGRLRPGHGRATRMLEKASVLRPSQ